MSKVLSNCLPPRAVPSRLLPKLSSSASVVVARGGCSPLGLLQVLVCRVGVVGECLEGKKCERRGEAGEEGVLVVAATKSERDS